MKQVLRMLGVAIGILGMTVSFLISGAYAQPDKVLICHKPGTPAQKELLVPASAVAAHLEHGDTLGPCGGGGVKAL